MADVQIDGTTLVIRIPMQAPAPSTSGKTLVVASTRGNLKTTCKIGDKEITIGVNAYIHK